MRLNKFEIQMYIDLCDPSEESLLRSIIRSNQYPHVLAADSGYWPEHLASSNGVLYFSMVGTPDRYVLRHVDAIAQKIYLKSGLITKNSLWEGDDPFMNDSNVIVSGSEVRDTRGAPHAELEGAALAAVLAQDLHLERFLLCIDNEGVFTKLKQGNYTKSKLDPTNLESVRNIVNGLGGAVAKVLRKDVIICDRLSRVPIEDSYKESVLKAYRHIRAYSTQSGVPSPETAKVLVLRTRELDQEIFKYVKEGKVEHFFTKEQMLQLAEIFQRIGDKLQVYVILPRAECKMSRPEGVVSDIASLFRDAGLPVKSIDTIMHGFPGFPDPYVREKEKSGTVGEENRSTIEASRILFSNNVVQVAFIDCVKCSLEIERLFNLSPCSTFSPRTSLALLCTYRAGNCARAFARGQAGFFLDNLNHNNIDNYVPPLHLAAQNISSGVTEALLMAVADPSLCCLNHDYDDDDDGRDDIANLPLSLALEALSCNPCVTDWSVEKSVAKLIYIFCLKELKEPLDTIRILASRTEALEKLSLQYAEKGQVVQLTALLLVAWNKLVTPYVKQQECRVEHCPIGQCIMKELQSLLSNQQITAQCTSDLVKLESAWKMLKLLESKYHQIDQFLLDKPLKKKGFAATNLLSKSFHTCSNQSSTNDKGRLITLTTKVEKPPFCRLFPTARTCAYLVSMAKRRLK